MTFLAVLFAFSVALVSGCNTVDGMGEDLQEASENTEEVIEGDE